MGLDCFIYLEKNKPNKNSKHIWTNSNRVGLDELNSFCYQYINSHCSAEYLLINITLDELKKLYIEENIKPHHFNKGLHHLKEIIDILNKHEQDLKTKSIYYYAWS